MLLCSQTLSTRSVHTLSCRDSLTGCLLWSLFRLVQSRSRYIPGRFAMPLGLSSAVPAPAHRICSTNIPSKACPCVFLYAAYMLFGPAFGIYVCIQSLSVPSYITNEVIGGTRRVRLWSQGWSHFKYYWPRSFLRKKLLHTSTTQECIRNLCSTSTNPALSESMTPSSTCFA